VADILRVLTLPIAFASKRGVLPYNPAPLRTSFLQPKVSPNPSEEATNTAALPQDNLAPLYSKVKERNLTAPTG